MNVKFIKYNSLSKPYFDSEIQFDIKDGIFESLNISGATEDTDPSDLSFYDCLLLSTVSNKHVRMIVCVRNETSTFIESKKTQNIIPTDEQIDEHSRLKFLETLKQIRNLYPAHVDHFDNCFEIEAIKTTDFPSSLSLRESKNSSQELRSKRATLAMRRKSIFINDQRYNYNHLLLNGSKSFFMKKGTSVLISQIVSDVELGWSRPYLVNAFL